MLVLLAVAGAVAVFAAGWAVGRALAPPIDAPLDPVELVRTPAPSYVDVLDRHATGVVVAGPSGVVEYRNPAAAALGGTHVGVLVDEAITRHLDVARRGTPSGETLDLYGPPRRVVVVSSEPLPNGRAVAFVDDVTDRRRADQARTDFVANVSHELRTPVGALMVLAETLTGEDDPEVVERVVARMLAEAERAARTIDDLLELSQIEAEADRDVGPVRLSGVVCEAVGRVAELAAAGDITLTTPSPDASAGDPSPEAVVLGDRRQLASAVGNMVENAVKYSDPGDVVEVDVQCDGSTARIIVRDEGVGIPRRDLDRVFERFYRVDRARSRSTGGTGLGLSIVRHVANNHGGSISVESIEGEGTTFVLSLPLLSSREPDAPTDREREGVA